MLVQEPVNPAERGNSGKLSSLRDRLNEQEYQLLTMVARGLSLSEIAEQIGSNRTQLLERVGLVQSKVAASGKGKAIMSGLRRMLRADGDC